MFFSGQHDPIERCVLESWWTGGGGGGAEKLVCVRRDTGQVWLSSLLYIYFFKG